MAQRLARPAEIGERGAAGDGQLAVGRIHHRQRARAVGAQVDPVRPPQAEQPGLRVVAGRRQHREGDQEAQA
jgi:hypothetical protein